MADIVLGVMSGTSLDGVDYALCKIVSPHRITLKGFWSIRYPRLLKERLLNCASDKSSSYETAQLHHDLGRFYADSAPRVKCDYIGLHGQTIFHNPKAGSTFQLGAPSYLATELNCPVVSQFREMDLALGGQGAPLATLFHREVFGQKGRVIAVNNLGGISNVTLINSRKCVTHSFDTGPANILIDRLMFKLSKGRRAFDKDGAMASRGFVNLALVEKWMGFKYFKIKPPKSTGREEFGEEFLAKAIADCKARKLKPQDQMATLTEFSARSIASAYNDFLVQKPDEVILCGGGAQNPALVAAIKRNFRYLIRKPMQVMTSDQKGWSTQSVEASAFALLAYYRMHEMKFDLNITTGASRPEHLGQVTLV